MKNTAKTRLYLFIGSALTILLVAAFLVILNINEPQEYTKMPFNVLWILTVIACVSLGLFFAKGPVFDINGRLERVNINAMLMTVLIVIQLAFFFEILSVRYQIMNYQLYESIRKDFAIACESDTGELNETLESFVSQNISEVNIIDEEGKALFSSDADEIGNTVKQSKYIYPFSDDTHIQFEVDPSYISSQLRDLILNLMTVLVTSIFFSIEIILLMIKVISRNFEMDVAVDDNIENSGNNGRCFHLFTISDRYLFSFTLHQGCHQRLFP